MSTLEEVELAEFMLKRSGSVNPKDFPSEEFELFSIPAFDAGVPESVLGSEIGSSKQSVQPGDVLLSKIVPHIRRAWIVSELNDKRQIASSEWIVFRDERIHGPYFRHLLVSNGFHAKFMNTVAGVGGSLLRARPSYVQKIKVPLPPLPEQKRIAEILDRAEALRRSRRAALALLDELTQSIFLDMFGDGKTGGMVTLETVCEQITDGTHHTPTYADEGVVFLSSRNVKTGFITWDDVKYIPLSLHRELQKRVSPKKGDILLAKNGTTGTAAIVDRECVFDIYVSLALLRPKSCVIPLFLKHAINSPYTKRQFDRSLKGVGVPNLHLKEIRKTSIPKATIAEQEEFARVIESVEAEKEKVQHSAVELDGLFASLQQRAFRGEL